jgi:peptidoglycan hydrolase-like protein with peptidoglycan-binding domain
MNIFFFKNERSNIIMAERFLLVGSKANLPDKDHRDPNKLYFCSDTRELYKGMDLYTEAVRVVSVAPSQPAEGILYIFPSGVARSYSESTGWTTVGLPYITSGTLEEDNLTIVNANGKTINKVPTAQVVYDSIAEAITNAVSGGQVVNSITSTKAGTITVTAGEKETDVAVSGVVVNPTYDPDTRTITLPYADGKESLVIALGKDLFLDANADNKYNEATGNIELYLNDGSCITIPAKSLIDVYTGAATSTATVSVSDKNVITADVKVSAKTENRLKVSDDGLLVDVTDLASKSELSEGTAKLDADIAAANESISKLQDLINVLNGDSSVNGSVDSKVKDAVTLIDNELDKLQASIDSINDPDTGVLAQAKTYVDSEVEDSTSWSKF